MTIEEKMILGFVTSLLGLMGLFDLIANIGGLS
jgi:hypothetical protein